MRRRFGLLPRDDSFFELFEQQATVLRECLPILTMMRKADIVDPNWALAMQAIEQRGDQLTSSIIRKAEQTFITPLDREDILALTVAVADLQRLFTLYIDKRKRREIAELSEAAVDACERVFHVLRNIYLKEL
jgi:uncharacterized protein Yka (UPF0111/DUF47 family)